MVMVVVAVGVEVAMMRGQTLLNMLALVSLQHQIVFLIITSRMSLGLLSLLKLTSWKGS